MPPSPRRPPLRAAVVLALGASHALILLGAYILLAFAPGARVIGAVVLAAGIAVELGVALWSLGRARREARLPTASGRPVVAPSSGRLGGPRLCLTCGLRPREATLVCPRCGHPTIPWPGRVPTAG